MKNVFVLACAVALSLASPGAQGKRFITDKDLFKFTWIADPQISPDGATVAFVRVTVNEKENRYETSIFAVPASGGGGPRRLTSGIRDTTPRWAPDGKRVAFVRSVEKDGKPQPAQVYLLQMDGGEARAITDGTSGAANPVWSPDGGRIAFTSSTNVADTKTPEDPKLSPDHKSDVEVVTRAVYRANGNPGYVDNDHHAHIFTIQVQVSDTAADRPQVSDTVSPKPHQITDGEFDEGGVQWSPDGATIYFTSTRVPEPYVDELGDEIYAVPAAGGAMTKVAAIEGSIGNLSVSPDGQRIAFVGTLRGNPIRSYSQPDLFVVDTPFTKGSDPDLTLAAKNLTGGYDFDIGGGIGGDQSAPRGGNRKPILWSPDGGSLIVVSAEKGSSNLKRVAIATGKVDPITDSSHDVVSYSATPDASKIAATLATQTQIGDIAIVDVARPFQGRDRGAACPEARRGESLALRGV